MNVMGYYQPPVKWKVSIEIHIDYAQACITAKADETTPLSHGSYIVRTSNLQLSVKGRFSTCMVKSLS